MDEMLCVLKEGTDEYDMKEKISSKVTCSETINVVFLLNLELAFELLGNIINVFL